MTATVLHLHKKTDGTPDALLPLPVVSRRLGLDVSTLRRWISAGRLRAFRIGPRAVRVRETDVDRLIVPLVPRVQRAMAQAGKRS